MYLLIYFIFGLIVGSFLNAVIFRLKINKSFLFGRSQCMNCKTELAAKDLVPLFSFLLLRGQCRYCKTKLSWQYPFVEFVTGILFVWFGSLNNFVIDLDLVYQLVFACAFLLIAVYDFKHFLILDKVVFPMLALAILLNIGLDFQTSCAPLFFDCKTLGGLTGAALASLFFLGQYVLSKGKWIGFGDVKFALLFGAVLGWQIALLSLFLAYLIGAGVGLGLVLTGRKQMSSQMPFGTFLGISGIISLGYGESLLNWYLQLVGFY